MEPAGGAFAVTIFYPTIDRSVVTRGRCARMGGFEIANAPGRPRMTIQARLLCAIAVSGFAALAATSPAQALTTQECSAKYQAAKTAGTLNGQKWNIFPKGEGGGAPPGAPRRHACCRTSRARGAEGRGSQAEGPRSRD